MTKEESMDRAEDNLRQANCTLKQAIDTDRSLYRRLQKASKEAWRLRRKKMSDPRRIKALKMLGVAGRAWEKVWGIMDEPRKAFDAAYEDYTTSGARERSINRGVDKIVAECAA